MRIFLAFLFTPFIACYFLIACYFPILFVLDPSIFSALWLKELLFLTLLISSIVYVFEILLFLPLYAYLSKKNLISDLSIIVSAVATSLISGMIFIIFWFSGLGQFSSIEISALFIALSGTIGLFSGIVFSFIHGNVLAQSPKMLLLKKIFISFFLILTVLNLFGSFSKENEESINQKKLKEIKVGEYKYLKEIFDEKWDEVCVLPPYQGSISSVDTDHYEFYNKHIKEFNIDTNSDSHWYLLLKNGENFSYERGIISIEQERFDENIENSFKELNFKPKGCASFTSGAFYKFKKTYKEYTHIYITLGEI